MAELDLDIVYRPGELNFVAEVLLPYRVKGVTKATASAQYSLSDRSVKNVVYEWMDVVAKHLDFDTCVTAAVEALLRQLPPAAIPCSKCGAIHGNVGKHTCSLYTIHNCGMCGHQW